MVSQSIELAMQGAIAAQREGRIGDAEQGYRAVLKAVPAHPVANHNLGILLAQRGELPASFQFFQAAVNSDPEEPLFWVSCARVLLLGGRIADALDVLQRAKARGLQGKGFDDLARHAHDLLGNAAAAPAGTETAAQLESQATALVERGAFDEAITLYRRALAVDPDFAEAHFHLGSVQSERGRVAEGFEHFMRRATLIHDASASRTTPSGLVELPHKVKHDREQRDYLRSLGLTDGAERFYLGRGDRVAGPAVNSGKLTPGMLKSWSSEPIKVLVIDDFLSSEALDRLRRYCAESTIWRRIYEAGYLGATPEDGFAAPLLAQIVEETRANYAALLEGHPFRYLGGFKYDSELSKGTNTHADFSAVNVNLYITDDDANLDPDSGGMRIYGRSAISEAEMRRYNGDEAALQRMLAQENASVRVIPHRSNRAVIFDSGLYHRTDQCRFREGYLNKRINVSLLFGDFSGTKV
jgi:tetratricopeptide (TPR) repeat protein